MKLRKFQALMLKNKTHNGPWTRELFSSEEAARRYFDNSVAKNGSNFFWADYEVVVVDISPAKKK